MKHGRVKEGERKVDIIHRTAAKILCDMGYDKASLRDIAEAVGMTKAGLYYYFDSKEELLFHILDGFMDELLEGMRKLHARISDPVELIRAIICLQIDKYCEDKSRSRLIVHDENCLRGDRFTQLKKKQREYVSYWKSALDKLCRHEGLPLDHLAVEAHCLMGMCVWIQQWYDPDGEVKPEQLAERIFSNFFHGLLHQIKMK